MGHKASHLPIPIAITKKVYVISCVKGVGKTTLMHRLTNNTNAITITANTTTYNLVFKEIYLCEISVTSKSDVLVYVFDATNEKSFAGIKLFLDSRRLRQLTGCTLKRYDTLDVFVANKIDLPRQVTTDQGMSLLDDGPIQKITPRYVETSSADDDCIQHLLETILEMLEEL